MKNFYFNKFVVVSCIFFTANLTAYGNRIYQKSQTGNQENYNAEIVSFTLINSQTNEELFEIKDGQVINLKEIGARAINIRANCRPKKTGSVAFSLRGPRNLDHVENIEPYALFKNDRNNYFNWFPLAGEYTLTATPFSEIRGRGHQGTSLEVKFTIVDVAIVTGFVLVNADNNKDIFEIEDGMEIDLKKLPTQNINIRANTNPKDVGSVEFSLTELVHDNFLSHVENARPYALFSDRNGNYYGRIAENGEYFLKAEPYERHNGTGKKGLPLSVSFTMINGLSSTASLTRSNFSLESFAVFPNPGRNFLNVNFEDGAAGNIEVQIFDTMGNSIMSKRKSSQNGDNNLTLNVSGLESKPYIIKVVSSHGTKTLRWVKEE